jgi:hypothetical protein
VKIRDGNVDIALPEVSGLVRLNVDCQPPRVERWPVLALINVECQNTYLRASIDNSFVF